MSRRFGLIARRASRVGLSAALWLRQHRLLMPLTMFGAISVVVLAGSPSSLTLTIPPEVTVTVNGYRRWVAVGLGLVALLLVLPRLQSGWVRTDEDKRRFEADDRARQTLFQIVAGTLLILGGLHAWFQLRYNMMTTERTLRAAHEGQVTERFTRAVDQLGSPQLEVRLGGIYALERVARDSPRDQETIVELLLAFVRTHAPWPRPAEMRPRSREETVALEAALKAIGRRTPETAPKRQPGTRWNLSNTDLHALDLSSGNFSDFGFTQCNLTGAKFRYSNLENSFFDESILDEASLWGATLRNAQFAEASLRCAVLVKSDASKARFHRANMERANIALANLTHASFARSNLRAAILSESDVGGASFAGTDLASADIGFEGWQGIQIMGARLDGIVGAPAGFLEWALAHGAITSAERPTANTAGRGMCQPPDW